MPGIDFDRVRAEITMEQVLSLLGFQPSNRSGVQWYGSCPLRESVLLQPEMEIFAERDRKLDAARERRRAARAASRGTISTRPDGPLPPPSRGATMKDGLGGG